MCSIPVADALGVDATAAVHVGDDPTNDKQGALAAGLESWYCKPSSTILPIFFLFILSDEMLTLLRLSRNCTLSFSDVSRSDMLYCCQALEGGCEVIWGTCGPNSATCYWIT